MRGGLSRVTETIVLGTKGRHRDWLRAASVLLVVLSLVIVLADLVHYGFGVNVFIVTHAMYLALPLAMILYAWSLHGRAFAALSAPLLFLGGIAVELIGTSTGLPFGPYYYTGSFQPQIAGIPLEIALGWLTLGLMSYSISAVSWKRPLTRILVAASLMVAWDVLYDPVFTALGMWVWRSGTYFGVPFSNFVGWFVTSTLFFSAFELSKLSRPRPFSLRPLIGPVAVYLAYMVDGIASNLSLGNPWAGVLGGTFMLAVLGAALLPWSVKRPLSSL
jgi:uncharacterized membrane protein